MRSSGILLPMFSLPSDYGIGTMGKEAYAFIDFLHCAKQTYWQMLPIGPTSYGDSPYQSFSSFAGNPYFIDFEMLCKDGLLKKKDFSSVKWCDNAETINYETLFKKRFKVLRKAYENGFERDSEKVTAFRKDNAEWLEDYALYMAVKSKFELKAWQEWDKDIKFREEKALEKYREELSDEMNFQVYVQYLFYSQWTSLKAYAAEKNIKLIGDVPIYVASDSADTWANPEIFRFDENLLPTDVAGCPPDAFSADGQLWGNPLYRWDVLEKRGFDWWIKRLQAASKLFDVIRIDHFRGFESYYTIPYGNTTAREGKWDKGPDMKFIKAIKSCLKDTGIIAEDLGFLTPEVRKMLKSSGFPGMKVLEFAFDHKSDSDYLPHNFEKNSVVYTGTHDNETVAGWVKGLSRKDRVFLKSYLKITKKEGWCYGVIRGAWASSSDTAIAQMQDFLELDNSARINEPSTLGTNWQWHMKKGVLNDKLAEKIADMTRLYRREVSK